MEWEIREPGIEVQEWADGGSKSVITNRMQNRSKHRNSSTAGTGTDVFRCYWSHLYHYVVTGDHIKPVWPPYPSAPLYLLLQSFVVVVVNLSVSTACGILVPNQGLNPCARQWKCRVLTTGHHQRSPCCSFSFFQIKYCDIWQYWCCFVCVFLNLLIF